MQWEERLLRELDDLEQQAEGLHLAEREAVVTELSVSGYAEVELSDRLHASVGVDVHLTLLGGATVDGVVTRAGKGWLLLGRDRVETIVRSGAILAVRGLSARAVPSEARSLTAQLGLGSALRQVAATREEVVLHLVDGTLVRGQLKRVGADFLEVALESGRLDLVALGALSTVRGV